MLIEKNMFIENLYKKYDISKYNFIKKKYGISKKEDLIFRFNRYNDKTRYINCKEH